MTLKNFKIERIRDAKHLVESCNHLEELISHADRLDPLRQSNVDVRREICALANHIWLTETHRNDRETAKTYDQLNQEFPIGTIQDDEHYAQALKQFRKLLPDVIYHAAIPNEYLGCLCGVISEYQRRTLRENWEKHGGEISPSHLTFLEACAKGEANSSTIDDWVEEWHEKAEYSDLELHEFLGMTEEEYAEWLVAPGVLHYIVSLYKELQEITLLQTENLSAAFCGSWWKKGEKYRPNWKLSWTKKLWLGLTGWKKGFWTKPHRLWRRMNGITTRTYITTA